jgi:tetratricopeptide (TPR) repeat protein
LATTETNGTAQEQAIVRYEGYVRLDPKNVPLSMALGDLYHRAGRFDEALACFDKCLAIRPDHAAAKSHTANVMLSQHRFAEAEQLLRGLMDDASPNPNLLHNIGLAVFYQGRFDQAGQAFERARELGLADKQNLLYNAYALHQQGQVKAAAALCRDWLSSRPDDGIDGYLAVLEMDNGEMPAASQRAEAVLQRQPGNADANLVASMCRIEQQDIQQAQRHIGYVLQAEPDSPRGWFAKGLVHMYREEHAQAIAAFETALRATPGHVGTIVTLAWARFAAHDISGAERTFREAIAHDRNFGEAHGGLAVTLLYLGQVEEARRETQLARRLNPNSLGAIWAQSGLLALGGRREAGEALIATALQRPLTADGKTMFDHIQTFVRQQAARTAPAQTQPAQYKQSGTSGDTSSE